jgi:hypothetical protein
VFRDGFHNRPSKSIVTPFFSDFYTVGNTLMTQVQDLSKP